MVEKRTRRRRRKAPVKKGPRKPPLAERVARLRAPKPNGRPPHLVTPASRGMVNALVLLGCNQDEIAAASGIDTKTLRKHYRETLDTAYLKAGGTLMHTAYLKGIGATSAQPTPNPELADTRMLIFLLTHRFGLAAPAQELKHSGAIGTFDLTKLTDDELSTLEPILARLAIAGGSASGDSEEGG